MQTRSVPAIGPRYWAGIALASVFGTNMGDFVSHDLHLGHVRGLPVLALAFAAIMFTERRSRGSEAFYWLGVVVVRTAATNCADLGTHDLKLAYPLVIAALVALLAALEALGRTLLPRQVAGEVPRLRPDAGLRYWAMMLVAGTLGTALGDFLDDAPGVGTGLGSALLGAVLALALLLRGRVPAEPGYWCVVVAARAAGTALGDFLAGGGEEGGLGLGLPLSTALTGLAFAGLLLLWQPRRGARLREA